jgi:hypothetical protein
VTPHENRVEAPRAARVATRRVMDDGRGTRPTIEELAATMTRSTPAARALAQQLLASAGPAPPAADDACDPVTAAVQVGHYLAAELSRWFGPYGYHALLARALADARAEHPALAVVRVNSVPSPELAGLADAARAHGAGAAVAGAEAVLASLIDLLGRLIGDDLAMTLIDRTILAMAPGAGDAPAQPNLGESE